MEQRMVRSPEVKLYEDQIVNPKLRPVQDSTEGRKEVDSATRQG